MNKRMVFRTIGRLLQITALLLLVPAIVAIIYGETKQIFAFAITALGSLVLGVIISLITKTKNKVIYAKDGFAITALAWIGMALVGAVPFVISGDIPNYVNAIFETVSGFTTTGASVLTNVEALSQSALFWRSFTHWIGGMGVLVFVMALLPNFTDRSIHIMRAEMPGPIVGKLVPRVKDTAKILYMIYIILTVLEIVLLRLGDMNWFESIVHAFGTAGTGGFGIKGDSIASYSPYSQWVIAIFMLIFGINFNVYYLLLMRRVRTALKSSELWCYISIVFVSITAITVNIVSMSKGVSEAIRNSVFQVASIISTTGYATADFNQWPGACKAILFLLMITGACAGSTAGGLKISRVVILFKAVLKEIRKMLHPRSVSKIHFEGKPLEDATMNSVTTYFVIYMICFLGAFLLISFENFGFESNFSAVVACFNNIGPGFEAVGPTSNYSAYTDFSKIVLSFAMLLGRLEIFPIIIFLSPYTWIKKK
ncbi:MAG: TrkH family potassium uptake protein [Clostridia bacterium]|nr:TrkH family potassium uptake protein [Clostridia bacterium]